jgi:hypothetical protein
MHRVLSSQAAKLAGCSARRLLSSYRPMLLWRQLLCMQAYELPPSNPASFHARFKPLSRRYSGAIKARYEAVLGVGHAYEVAGMRRFSRA